LNENVYTSLEYMPMFSIRVLSNAVILHCAKKLQGLTLNRPSVSPTSEIRTATES